MLPRDFPTWQAVRSHFDQWQREGRWEQIDTALREQAREAVGRSPTPTAGLIASQRVTTSAAGREVGYEGGKQGDGAQAGLTASIRRRICWRGW